MNMTKIQYIYLELNKQYIIRIILLMVCFQVKYYKNDKSKISRPPHFLLSLLMQQWFPQLLPFSSIFSPWCLPRQQWSSRSPPASKALLAMCHFLISSVMPHSVKSHYSLSQHPPCNVSYFFIFCDAPLL